MKVGDLRDVGKVRQDSLSVSEFDLVVNAQGADEEEDPNQATQVR